MRKLKQIFLASSILIMGGATISNAQIQEGNLMVGVNLANIDLDLQKNNTRFGLGITPKIGYFIQDNLALGGELGLGFESAKNTFAINYNISAFGRYYIGDPRAVILNHSRFFLEANAGIAGRNYKVKDVPSASTNGLGLGIGAGVAYFITPNIGLETLLKYNQIVGFGTSPTTGGLSLNIGFQIYIPTSKARDVYQEASSEARDRYSN